MDRSAGGELCFLCLYRSALCCLYPLHHADDLRGRPADGTRPGGDQENTGGEQAGLGQDAEKKL